MPMTDLRTAKWTVTNVLVVLYVLLPVAWIASLSFADLGTGGTSVRRGWTLDHYAEVFRDEAFVRGLVNSIGIGLISTLVAVVFGAMAAYAVARVRFPGRRPVLGLALLIAMFPQISLVTPLFQIERSAGLLDTWPGLILPYAALALPLTIYTLSVFFRDIPVELERAARMDGATSFQVFRRVTVPLAAPGVLTTAILAFLLCWNDFLFALSLTSSKARTAPAALSSLTGGAGFEEAAGAVSAAAMVITIPIALLVLFFQRRIVTGLTSGVVKG